MLEGKTAVVYGGGGFVGGAVARAFAREGARVFLAGRTLAKLDQVAAGIAAAGGVAETARLDVLDAEAVDAHADAVAARSGGIDVAFNAVSYGDVQGAPLAEMPLDDFARPVTTALRAHFLTVRAAARHMVPRRSGVILTVTGYGPPYPSLGGTAVAWSAVEAQYRQWACELGPAGVRVAWLRTGGFLESILGAASYESVTMLADGARVPLSELAAQGRATAAAGGDETLEQELASLRKETMLKRLPSLAEAGSAAVFLASDHARSVTATAVNVTGGSVAD